MVEKKTHAKKTTHKDTAKKIEDVASKVKDEAVVIGKEVEEKGKVLWGGLSAWWNESTPAERVSMILWILVLACGLRLLRGFVVGIVLILLGVMGITGFFVKK